VKPFFPPPLFPIKQAHRPRLRRSKSRCASGQLFRDEFFTRGFARKRVFSSRLGKLLFRWSHVRTLFSDHHRCPFCRAFSFPFLVVWFASVRGRVRQKSLIAFSLRAPSASDSRDLTISGDLFLVWGGRTSSRLSRKLTSVAAIARIFSKPPPSLPRSGIRAFPPFSLYLQSTRISEHCNSFVEDPCPSTLTAQS